MVAINGSVNAIVKQLDFLYLEFVVLVDIGRLWLSLHMAMFLMVEFWIVHDLVG